MLFDVDGQKLCTLSCDHNVLPLNAEGHGGVDQGPGRQGGGGLGLGHATDTSGIAGIVVLTVPCFCGMGFTNLQ